MKTYVVTEKQIEELFKNIELVEWDSRILLQNSDDVIKNVDYVITKWVSKLGKQ